MNNYKNYSYNPKYLDAHSYSVLISTSKPFICLLKKMNKN